MRIGRRTASMTGAAGLALAGMVGVPAQPASASSSCSITGPTRITIDQPFREVVYTLGGDCPKGAHASWDFVHASRGFEHVLIFDDGARKDFLDVYSWAPIGSYSLRPSLAYTGDFSQKLSQNRLAVTVKAGQRASLKTARKGNNVTLTASGSYYRTTSDTWGARSKAKVIFQKRANSSGPWTNVRTATTDAKGAVTVTVPSAKAAQWRVVYPATASVWDTSSSVQKR